MHFNSNNYLNLTKKANSLKEDMDQLNNLENELKQLSGIELPDGNNGDSVNPEQNGQGGPYPQTPTIENVRLTLDTVENTMNGKLNNMEELKKTFADCYHDETSASSNC